MRNRGQLIAVIGFLFVVGVLLIIIGQILRHGQETLPYADICTDLGMVLAPIAVVSVIYEMTVRRETQESLQKYLEELLHGHSRVKLVFEGDRLAVMERIINDATSRLVIIGISPLIEFGARPRWLTDKLKGLESVTIAYLWLESEHVQARIAQGGVHVKDEMIRHGHLIDIIRESNMRNVEFIEYDAPPAEFCYVADQRLLLAAGYPFGKAEDAPYIFIENAHTGEESQKVLLHYKDTVEFLRLRTRHAPAPPPATK